MPALPSPDGRDQSAFQIGIDDDAIVEMVMQFGRPAATGFFILMAALMAGAGWKAAVVGLLAMALHVGKFGARWIEKLALVAVVLASIGWIDVIPFARMMDYARHWIAL